MSHSAALLHKEFVQHGRAVVSVTVLCAVAVFLIAGRLQAGMSLSSFDVVRASLISVLPLVALLLGNRLVHQEFYGHTQHFLEALPIRRAHPLLLKYALGAGYLSLVMTLLVAATAWHGRQIDSIDALYFVLVLVKTLSIVLLVWSLVFTVSLCGRLRPVLYLLVIGLLFLVPNLPGVDLSSFGPFALMDQELFTLERQQWPWPALIGTWALSLGLGCTSLVLGLMHEGALAERLARPMERRDLVALGVVAAGILTMAATLTSEPVRVTPDLAGSHVLRQAQPLIELAYNEPQHERRASELMALLDPALMDLLERMGQPALPAVRIVLDPERGIDDMSGGAATGVFLRANYVHFDRFENTMLLAEVAHHVFQGWSNERVMFEPYHWLLDGYVQWWADRVLAADPDTRNEWLAMAGYALRRLPEERDLLHHWQLIADGEGYPVAMALAWSMLHYVSVEHGDDVVDELARELLAKPVASDSRESLRYRFDSVQARIEQLLGVSWRVLNAGWRDWLAGQIGQAEVAARLLPVPDLVQQVHAVLNEQGRWVIQVRYSNRTAASAASTEPCVVKHSLAWPFDTENITFDDEELEGPCRVGEVAHVIDSRYGRGDRVHVVSEYHPEGFHGPVQIGSSRVNLQ